jgi:hypothetical protein
MTPQGMKRTEDISPDEFIPKWSKRKFAILIVSVAVIAIALLMFRLWDAARSSTPRSPGEKSIAVLPFVYLSQSHDQTFICELNLYVG